jgi:hypothetical protein
MNAVNINFLQEINKALLHSIHHILKDKTTSWDTLGLKPTQGGIAFKRVTNTKQSITSSLLNDPTNDKYLPLPNNFPQDATSEAKLKAREKLLLNTYNRSNKCELQAIPELPQEQLTPPTPREQPPSSPFLITPTFITSVSTYLDPSILIPALRLHLDIDTFTNTTLKSLHNTFHLQSFRTNFNLPTRIQNPLSLSTDHTKDFLAQLRPHCRQAYSFVYATNIVLSKINNPTSSSKPPPPPPVNNNDNIPTIIHHHHHPHPPHLIILTTIPLPTNNEHLPLPIILIFITIPPSLQYQQASHPDISKIALSTTTQSLPSIHYLHQLLPHHHHQILHTRLHLVIQ